MLTILWDNDGLLVDTEGMYFQACREVLGSVGIDLTLDQFREISLRRGESTFVFATDRGVLAKEVAQLRKQRDQRYSDLLETRSCVIDGVEDALRSLHGQVNMGVVTSAQREHFETIHEKSQLLQYIDFVLTREDYEKTKPHPEPYLPVATLSQSTHGVVDRLVHILALFPTVFDDTLQRTRTLGTLRRNRPTMPLESWTEQPSQRSNHRRSNPQTSRSLRSQGIR